MHRLLRVGCLILGLCFWSTAGGCSDQKRETVILVSAKKRMETLRRNTTIMRLKKLAYRIEEFKKLAKRYPERLGELTSLRQLRVMPFDMLDGWQTPFTYSIKTGTPRVCSAGPNKKAGDDDDLCRPES